MKRFKIVIASLWGGLTQDKRVIAMDVPRHCNTRAEKMRIIKATEIFLERNIIIN